MSHLIKIYTVCPLVFEFVFCFSVVKELKVNACAFSCLESSSVKHYPCLNIGNLEQLDHVINFSCMLVLIHNYV